MTLELMAGRAISALHAAPISIPSGFSHPPLSTKASHHSFLRSFPMEEIYQLLKADATSLMDVCAAAKDWAQAHGLLMRSNGSLHTAPYTLLPSKFDKGLLLEVMDLQANFNLLYHNLAHERSVLKESLTSVFSVDEFNSQLWSIYEKVLSEGIAQPVSLDIQRSDYMLSSQGQQLDAKQIEVNNIAVSLSALSSLTRNLHAHVLGELGWSSEQIRQVLPQNDCLEVVARGIYQAHEHYGVRDAAVVFIIEEQSTNLFDQRLLEYAVKAASGIGAADRSYRFKILAYVGLISDQEPIHKLAKKTLVYRCYSRLRLATQIIPKSKNIALLENDQDQAGYIPSDYHTQDCWTAREMIERSRAIKCPWIGFHLCGAKKIQQVLTDSHLLSKFVKDSDIAQRLQSTFVGIYALDGSHASEEVIEKACASPDDFVLKPQREGGGNNIYGSAVKTFLETVSPEERKAYILMERIRPPVHPNYLVRNGQERFVTETVSELGVYSYILGSKDVIIAQESGGFLLRTKPANCNEGGVTHGEAFLDTPLFVA